MSRTRNLSLEHLDLPVLRPDLPKGGQIRETLENLAADLGPGNLLPSDRALAEHFGVARQTVRAEVGRLVADGVLVNRPAQGIYVADLPPRPRVVGMSFSEDMRLRGFLPGAEVIEQEVLEVTGRLGDLLRAERGSRAMRLVRLRTADGIPMGLERSYISLARFPGLEEVDFGNLSLYHLLQERWGVHARGVNAVANAVMPDKDEARLLDISASQACMVVRSVQRDAQDQVIEAGRSIYRGDRYDLDISYTLPR